MRLKLPILAVCASLLLAILACNMPATQPPAGPSAPTIAAMTLAALPPAATPTPAAPIAIPPTAFIPSPVPPTATPPALAPAAAQPPAPQAPAALAPVEPPTSAAPDVFVAQLNVKDYGYSPEVLDLPAGQPIELHLVTDNVHSCSRAFTIPALGVEEILPESGDVVVSLSAQSAGTDMDFMCSMGMFTGIFQFK
jgi:hypothetical protein